MSEYHAPNPQGAFAPEDIEKNKVVSAFAYFIFFLPLIVCSASPFGRFHANQGLLLLIVSVAANIVLSLIPFLGWILLSVLWIGVLVFAIMGLVNTLNGKALELPLIGKWRIIK